SICASIGTSRLLIDSSEILFLELRDPRLDPTLRLGVHLTGVPPACRDRRADSDVHHSRLFPQTAAWPESPRIMGDGNDQASRLGGEQRTTHPIATRLTERHARPLREYHHPVAFGDALLTLRHHLTDRRMSGAPVDGDGMQ